MWMRFLLGRTQKEGPRRWIDDGQPRKHFFFVWGVRWLRGCRPHYPTPPYVLVIYSSHFFAATLVNARSSRADNGNPICNSSLITHLIIEFIHSFRDERMRYGRWRWRGALPINSPLYDWIVAKIKLRVSRITRVILLFQIPDMIIFQLRIHHLGSPYS